FVASLSIIDRSLDMFAGLTQSFGCRFGPVELVKLISQTDRPTSTSRLLTEIQPSPEPRDLLGQAGFTLGIGGRFVVHLEHECHGIPLENQNSMWPQLPPDRFLPRLQSWYLK